MSIRFTLLPIIISVLALVGLSYSQELPAEDNEAFPVLTGAYLGQKPPGLVPEIFAPSIVSTDAFEFSVAFSPDGKELFFTRRTELTKPGNRLLYMKEENGVWTEPQLAPFAEDCIEYEPFMSPDGRRVYFNSERPHPVTGKKMVNDEKVWYSERTGSGWGKANYLEGIINTGWIMNPSITLDGTIYICGEVDGKGGILRSELADGEYRSVESLFKGAHPYISPNENYLIFDRAGKSWAETELYISYQTKTGEWSEARKLGPEINATKTEAYAFVTVDGEYLFFNRGGDVYWIDAKVLVDRRKKRD